MNWLAFLVLVLVVYFGLSDVERQPFRPSLHHAFERD